MTAKSGLPKARLECFSDGVIAIVITLLVLEIKIPQVAVDHGEAALIAAIWHELPKFVSYFVSFFVLAVWWVVHHQFFHFVHTIDRKLIWFNNVFLMWLCLIPFPTALLGEYPSTRTAACLYGAVTTLAATTFFCMRRYASVQARLLDPDIPQKVIDQSLKRSVMAPLLHGLAAAIAVIAPSIALTIYAVLALYFAFPAPLDRHLTQQGT